MMKLLHAADLHLDTPLTEMPELKQALLTIPGQLARLCRAEGCQAVLISGDLFDGPWTGQSVQVLKSAMEEMAVPVFVSPGNHDHLGAGSVYRQTGWPGNVHIFQSPTVTALEVETLGLKVYGAGYHGIDCPPLLEGFRAEGEAMYHVAVLHGDPGQVGSPYCPVTAAQVRESALDYLALGHIHKGGSFRAGQTLCAWPGCAMGRGWDETGEKGALIVTLDGPAQIRQVTLEGPRFHDLRARVEDDPVAALERILPVLPNEDYYRVELTGEAEPPDLGSLRQSFRGFPHLELVDRTVAPVDLWGAAGEDTLEGVYFQILRSAMEKAGEEERKTLELAARISRQILNGREVELP